MAEIDVQGMNIVADEFEGYPRRSRRAVVRALNRGGSAADTFMARAIARDMGIKVATVKAAMRRQQASEAAPEFTLAARFKRIPLMDFAARGPVPSRGRGRGVSYRMGTGNGRNRNAHAFIATMKSGHQGVFARSGRARLPVRELFGPSVGKVFATYRPDAQARGLEVFESTLYHELERLSDGN